MPVRKASAEWRGDLRKGSGNISTESGVLKNVAYNFASRFEQGRQTNPEELIAAAHAGCFAMQLSHFLAENGTVAENLEAKAVVTYGPAAGGGFEITESALTLVGKVPGIDEAKFKELAEKAKAGCPVSGALGAIKVTLDARLA